jgi:hypothetical protein
MIFDKDGFPRILGADDYADSSHLAGLMAITNHPKQQDLTKYIVEKPIELRDGKFNINPNICYVRHPNEYRYDFSRDQFIVWAAGAYKQGHADKVTFDYVTGKDFMPPSVKGMVRIIKGGQARWYEKKWFEMELWVNYMFQRIEE